jgi:signal peptidase I
MSRGDTRGWLPEWVVTIVVVVFGITWLIQPFVIPTSSMENLLLVGDYLLVDKLAYSPAGRAGRSVLPFREVRRGDVVVFRFPLNLEENYVKRAIGLPGDRVRIEKRQVYVNGARLDEPYVKHTSPRLESYRDTFPAPPAGPVTSRGMDMIREHAAGDELVVPAGQYFVLGDNRDDSLDSRYWGFVPRDHIIGKPVMVFWSFDATTERLATRGVRWEHLREVLTNFFTKTRWDRTFKLVRGHRFE